MRKVFYLIIFLLLLKAPTIGQPVFWDVANYVVPSGQHFAEQGLLTLAEPDYGHPPLVFWILGTLYRVFGEHAWVVSMLSLIFASITVYYCFHIAEFFRKGSGFIASLLLVFSPMFFAQSSLMNTDIAVAALSLAVIYYALKNNHLAYIIASILCVLSKETGIFAVIASAFILREKKYALVGITVLGLWLGFYYFLTGSIFHPLHVSYLGIIHTGHFRYLVEFFNLPIVFLILWKSKKPSEKSLPLIGLCIIYLLFFAMYDQVLIRHMLPVIPFIFIGAAYHISKWKNSYLITAGFIFLFASQWATTGTSQCGCDLEANMDYRNVLYVQGQAASWLEEKGEPVMTAWPMTIQLRNPALGYVDQPMLVLDPDPGMPCPGYVYVSSQYNVEDMSVLQEAMDGYGLVLVKEFSRVQAWAGIYKCVSLNILQ